MTARSSTELRGIRVVTFVAVTLSAGCTAAVPHADAGAPDAGREPAAFWTADGERHPVVAALVRAANLRDIERPPEQRRTLYLVLSTDPDQCTRLQGMYAAPTGALGAGLLLEGSVEAGSAMLLPGTYSFVGGFPPDERPSTHFAWGVLVRSNGVELDEYRSPGASGAIEIRSIGELAVEVEVHVAFEGGERLEGVVSAVPCDFLTPLPP